ncbi:MAG: alkaline phosphatase family protein, partial [Chloroflexia bacterium]
MGLQTAGVSPEEWIGLPTAYERLRERGVETIVVNHREFQNTSLSLINHRAARYRGFYTMSDLAVNLRHAIEHAPRPAYIHAYWGTLDSIAHAYGTGSAQHAAEVQQLDHAIGEVLLSGLRAPGTLVLLFADHGHIDCTPDRVVWYNDHPRLLDTLTSPPAGLDRATVLYVRPGRLDEARAYLAAELGHVFEVLTAEESVELGLYGPPPPTPVA